MYSDQVKEHFANPRNMGELEEADAEGRAGEPGRGNYMIIWVRVEGERIAETGFKTYGCPPAIAAGSCVTEMAKGRTVQQALKITREEVIEALGGLPLGREHCAALAVESLSNAVVAATSASAAEEG